MSITKFLRILLNESGMDGMYQFAPGERHVELVAAHAQIARLVAAYDANLAAQKNVADVTASLSFLFAQVHICEEHATLTTAKAPRMR